jgi:hypothetical protein
MGYSHRRRIDRLRLCLLARREDGWRWARLEDAAPAWPAARHPFLLLYFPFYLGFSSQAGGILPNFMYPTRGMHLWVMWGTLLIPIFAFLLYVWSAEEQERLAPTGSWHSPSALDSPSSWLDSDSWASGSALSLKKISSMPCLLPTT